MRRYLSRSHARTVIAFSLTAVALAACSTDDGGITAPPAASVGQRNVQDTRGARGLEAAIAAQEKHTNALLRLPGVVGTAVGLNAAGHHVVRIFVQSAATRSLPETLDGVGTSVELSGMLMALSDPTTRQRPAPLGFSVGHPAITAGTIGARVIDDVGNVFVLSNNHVLANSNGSSLGDPILQPGSFDGGTAADQIGTLAAFRQIDFRSRARNTMDAAIALSSAADVLNSTPLDDGYGTPSGDIFGDANGDGMFDDRNALLGRAVQKYGRTTQLTKGQITGVNATLTICYEVQVIFCTKSARFVDQLIIEPGGFSEGGDSGSLIVTDNAGLNPVALLFAGSTTQTIANRIDLVLSEFDVAIDGGNGSPPPGDPVTDIAVTSVSAPASLTIGSSADVQVTVRNVGNQNVATTFAVALADATDGVALGSQNVAGLAAGVSTTLTYQWNTTGATLGSHTLTASHDFLDDNAGNDQNSTSASVNPPSIAIHSGNLDGFPIVDGNTNWNAVVEVTVHDANHQPLNGVTVRGTWSRNGLASDECVTGELGGNGSCIFLFTGLKKNAKFVDFTIASMTADGFVYAPGSNHDPDGSSNGTTIRVVRP